MYAHITEGYTPEKKKNNTNSKGYMHPNVHSNTIYNCQHGSNLHIHQQMDE